MMTILKSNKIIYESMANTLLCQMEENIRKNNIPIKNEPKMSNIIA